MSGEAGGGVAKVLALTGVLVGLCLSGCGTGYNAGGSYDIETGSWTFPKDTPMHEDPLYHIMVKDGWHYEKMPDGSGELRRDK